MRGWCSVFEPLASGQKPLSDPLTPVNIQCEFFERPRCLRPLLLKATSPERILTCSWNVLRRICDLLCVQLILFKARAEVGLMGINGLRVNGFLVSSLLAFISLSKAPVGLPGFPCFTPRSYVLVRNSARKKNLKGCSWHT